MKILRALALVASFVIAAAGVARAAGEASLFRVFLTDGSSIVTFGELARVGDQAIFSMPVGGTADDPRLHPVTMAASLIDWPRTERHTASVRFQQYSLRAESDYQRLTDEVAALLSDIALSTDRERALSLAQQARRTLADWPRTRFGYRQEEIREITALIDAAIARLGGTPPGGFEVSLVAMTEPVVLEPLAGMPSPREQLDQIVRVLAVTAGASERIALLEAGLALLDDRAVSIDRSTVTALRRSLESQLRAEKDIDRRYAEMTRQLLARATRAAAAARIADVERVLLRMPTEDERLGRRRPEVVQSLATSLNVQLDRARRLRLLRDQWNVRRSLYRDYQRSVGSEIVQLVKAQAALEAIRRLDGPEPDRLDSLRARLSGGAARLERVRIPEHLRSTHDLLISAWRFAESATDTRRRAVVSGDIAVAWEASSAAAGSLMMLSRAQQEIRALLQPPTLP
jgi:hypothetical protein